MRSLTLSMWCWPTPELPKELWLKEGAVQELCNLYAIDRLQFRLLGGCSPHLGSHPHESTRLTTQVVSRSLRSLWIFLSSIILHLSAPTTTCCEIQPVVSKLASSFDFARHLTAVLCISQWICSEPASQSYLLPLRQVR